MARLISVASVVIAAVGLGLPCSVSGDSVKQDDGLKQLEKRVADLEKEVAELRAQLKLAPKTALDNKLLGNWAAKDKDSDLRGLRLEQDGTCSMARRRDGPAVHFWKGKYEVIGKTIRISVPGTKVNEYTDAITYSIEVLSVGEKELVVKERKNLDKKEQPLELERQ